MLSTLVSAGGAARAAAKDSLLLGDVLPAVLNEHPHT